MFWRTHAASCQATTEAFSVLFPSARPRGACSLPGWFRCKLWARRRVIEGSSYVYFSFPHLLLSLSDCGCPQICPLATQEGWAQILPTCSKIGAGHEYRLRPFLFSKCSSPSLCLFLFPVPLDVGWFVRFNDFIF